MSKQTINIGTSANDGTGDPLQTAFGKVNQNFTEVYTIAQGAEPAIAAATGTPAAQYWRGDKTFQTLNATAVGLSNVNNTSDVNKPISTATQNALNLLAPQGDIASTGITMAGSALLGRKNSGTGTVYALVPGDVKTLLGLDQVSNTADADKPISTATQTALTAKLNKSDTLLATQYITTSASQVLLGRNSSGAGAAEELTSSVARTILGINNVTNTADADKPVSTAQQTALDLKFNKSDSLAQSQVTGLSDALGAKLDKTGAINLTQVNGLQDALDLKYNTSDATTALALKADKTQITYSVKAYMFGLTTSVVYNSVVDTAFAVTTANCAVNVIHAPNSDTTFTVQKNGTPVGTLVIKSGTTGYIGDSNNVSNSNIVFNWVNSTPPSFAAADVVSFLPTGGVDDNGTNQIALAVVIRN